MGFCSTSIQLTKVLVYMHGTTHESIWKNGPLNMDSRAKNNCWPLAVFRACLPNGQPFPKEVGHYGQPYTCTDDYATIPLNALLIIASLHELCGYPHTAYLVVLLDGKSS